MLKKRLKEFKIWKKYLKQENFNKQMIKILITGEGGQGVQAIAEILAKAAFLENKQALYIPNFGVEQRGGVSLAFVIIDNKPIVYPKFEKADILAIFSERSRERIKNFLNESTEIIEGPAITGQDKGLPPKTWNILVLGRINQSKRLVSQKNLVQALEERFS
jgi:2-oxoglutarate ferredoxin oxidoreductase subunit gamma